ncbi:MAG: SpoIIE family protein phosphatase [Bacteroidetes bacterium]|nr:SpoIIE family protein phosphatase [Bacteroidota bacterium]
MKLPSLKKSCLLLSLLFLSTGLFAQSRVVKTIGIEDGLSTPIVSAILQDSEGLMWFGTFDGLNVYDGKKLVIYRNIPGDSTSINNNQIYFITEDKKGNLWIITNGQLARLNKTTRKFKNYSLNRFRNLIDNNSTAPQAISAAVIQNGDVFISASFGPVVKYDESQDTFIPVKGDYAGGKKEKDNTLSVPLMVSDSNDNLFIGEYNNSRLLKKLKSDSAFSVVKLSEADAKVMSEEDIKGLFVLNPDSLFIVTRKSVFLAHQPSFRLERFYDFVNPTNILPGSGATADKKGNIWFASTGTDGIQLFNRATKTIKPYDRFNLKNENDVVQDFGLSLFADNAGLIWLGTLKNGIQFTDPDREPIDLYRRDAANPKSISIDKTFAVHPSKLNPDLIYVGTAGGGISILNEKTNEFEQFPIQPIQDFYKTGSARAIVERPDGKLWVGTWGDGLRLYDLKTKSYTAYTRESAGNAVQNMNIRTIAADSKGRLWVGGEKGLDQIDQQTGKVTSFYSKTSADVDPEVYSILRQKINSPVAALTKLGDYVDTTIKITIPQDGFYGLISVGEGTLGSGDSIHLFDYGWLEDKNRQPIEDLFSKNQRVFYFSGADKNRISVLTTKLTAGTYYLRYISDDSHSWGKWNQPAPLDPDWWGVSLISLTPSEEEVIGKSKRLKIKNTVLAGSNITVLKTDDSGQIYIGTNGAGYQVFNPESMKLKTFKKDRTTLNSLSNNSVSDLLISSKNQVWISTADGLNLYDPVSDSFRKFSSEDGLSGNLFSSVLEDLDGNIWVSGLTGISRITISEQNEVNIVNYDKSDGLQGGGFTSLVSGVSASGRLYFGGDNGLNGFYPGQVNSNPPEMAFTSIYISKTDEDISDLITRMFAGETVVLSHDQNDISIDFAALHYTRPEKNKLSHQLVGYDDNWVNDNRSFVNYTNLPPGTYTLKIKGSNSDGFWSDGSKSISFQILPPWWATWWAYGLYVVVLFGGIYSFHRFQKGRIIAKGKAKLALKEAELRAVTAEAQAKIIQAEHDRKSIELEEARQLQLSMLPKFLPQIPNLDIAVYMKTATEVGGDYYDFHLSSDGTLTVVIADATGHGLKAGTLVTAAKSLFNSHASNHDILFSLREFSRCILALDFYHLSMCMSFLKIKNNRFQLGSAGMPPMLVYRAATQKVDEFVVQGAPLGTFIGFPYQIESQELHSGDVILLMTDGFPELISNKGEVFNYMRVSELFRRCAQFPPARIIEEFEKVSLNWLQGKEADDDLTFVVMKVK